MSTRRKTSSRRPGTVQKPLEPVAPMTFDERLVMYTIRQVTPKSSRRPDGLTPNQYKRLIKKDRHAFAIAP